MPCAPTSARPLRHLLACKLSGAGAGGQNRRPEAGYHLRPELRKSSSRGVQAVVLLLTLHRSNPAAFPNVHHQVEAAPH